jgi:hypothetical protein
MLRQASLHVVLAAALIAATACARPQKSAQGFHLPDGDPRRGREVFVAMRCHACHAVPFDQELPTPVADPPVPVLLGGVVIQARTDGELAAAIVDPSHRIASGFRPEEVRSGRLSRMGEFGESLTVRELVDLVAYLQSRYEVREPAVTP